MANTMTAKRIAQLNVACHYWAMARRQNDSKAAAIYYDKAYTILRQEMGTNEKNTLELRKEMTEFLSNKTVTMTVVRKR